MKSIIAWTVGGVILEEIGDIIRLKNVLQLRIKFVMVYIHVL